MTCRSPQTIIAASACLTMLAAALLMTGCSEQDMQRWDEEARRWEQFWGISTQPASAPASQPATAPGETASQPVESLDEVDRLRLQRDRLLATNRLLQGDIEQLRARVAELERRLEEQSRDLEIRRGQLRQALDTLRQSREEWETILAERQRQVEVLTNQVERLKRELARPATRE